MHTSLVIKAGSFWDLHRRLSRSEAGQLVVVGCSELGCRLDRLLGPGGAQHIYQNGGGSCFDLLRGPRPPLSELLILHHEPCAFYPPGEPGMSLVHEWRNLKSCATRFSTGSCLTVHLWLFDSQANLRVLNPESRRLQSPIELSNRINS